MALYFEAPAKLRTSEERRAWWDRVSLEWRDALTVHHWLLGPGSDQENIYAAESRRQAQQTLRSRGWSLETVDEAIGWARTGFEVRDGQFVIRRPPEIGKQQERGAKKARRASMLEEDPVSTHWESPPSIVRDTPFPEPCSEQECAAWSKKIADTLSHGRLEVAAETPF
jgi:hypothetical protein